MAQENDKKLWRRKSAYPGVYVRTNGSRFYDGQPDECYYIVYYDENSKYTYENIGWKSEGFSVEDAVLLRSERIKKKKEVFDKKKNNKKNSDSGRRVKTRYPGVYVRTSPIRICSDGQQDKCYDIMYYDENNKLKYEKVGWKSEGISIHDAISLRTKKTKKKSKDELSVYDPVFQDVWEQYKQNWFPNLKGKTNILNRINRYILPEFRNYRISSITSLEVEKLKRKLLTQKSHIGLSGLKAGTVRTILADLRRVLKKAAEWGLYKGSLPVFHLPSSDDKRERFLTPAEANRFLDNLTFISCDLYYISKISLYTGMRLSEVLNLTASNINFDSKIIYVNGKTGNRVSYMSSEIVADLKKLVTNREHYLFVGKNGQKLKTSKVSKEFGDIINAMGFNKSVKEQKHKFVFHTLRHTFCSWLAMKGVPLLTIGELVGHTTLEMTHRYAKLSPDTKRVAIEIIGEVIKERKIV